MLSYSILFYFLIVDKFDFSEVQRSKGTLLSRQPTSSISSDVSLHSWLTSIKIKAFCKRICWFEMLFTSSKFLLMVWNARMTKVFSNLFGSSCIAVSKPRVPFKSFILLGTSWNEENRKFRILWNQKHPTISKQAGGVKRVWRWQLNKSYFEKNLLNFFSWHGKNHRIEM